MLSDAQLKFSNDTTPEDIEIVEIYAQRIEANNCPALFSDDHLSEFLGFEKALIYTISNSPSSFYRTFYIKKNNGNRRKISEPLPTLKEIQHNLLENLFNKISVHRSARAYRIGTGIRSNASLHTRQQIVINLDIKDFFDSIKITSVYKILYDIGYTRVLSSLIANLCCKDGSLPQGAPTSPILSNIFMRDFDQQMLAYCRERSLRYSRYADDITISGSMSSMRHIRVIRNKLRDKHLTLNEKKTSISREGSRKIVTGIVVNDKLNAPLSVRKEFRKCVHFIRKFGLDSHISHENIDKPNYIDHLIGRGEFIKYCNRKDTQIIEDIEFLRTLKEYYT